MPFSYLRWIFIFLSLSCSAFSFGKTDSLGVHTDFIYYAGNTFSQDVYLVSPQALEADITIACYYYTQPGDSILIYNLKVRKRQIAKGVSSSRLSYNGKGGDQFIQPAFARVMRKTGITPPGVYKTYLSLHGGTADYRKTFLYEKDSMLAINSFLRNDLLQLIAPATLKAGSGSDVASTAFRLSDRRLERYFRKQGLTSVRYQKGGKEVLEVYGEGWFLGKYELESDASVSGALSREQGRIKNNIGSFTENDLSGYSSLMSQFRELKKNSKENDELSGEIAVSGNFSSDQEEYSMLDNNYYELRGSLEFPVFDIPIIFSGYYTSQDHRREAKASYFHFKYDARKAKDQLMALIGGYKQQYQQVIDKGSGYQMIYGQYVSRLKGEQAEAMASLQQMTDLPDYDPGKYNEAYVREKITENLLKGKDKVRDSVGRVGRSASEIGELEEKARQVAEIKEQAEAKYLKAMETYNRLQEISEKLARYETLLSQYKNTNYFDSLLVYDQVKDIGDIDQLSYKDLSKKASHLLPEGKAKSAMAGLVSFDAGIFPNYISDYTMSGQMMKGLDAAYDVGFGAVGGSYGTTEFIDRAGHVENYKAYSARVTFKPLLRQQVGFVYYGYSPGRKLLGDQDFFKSTDVSIPSFRNPVHILSGTYKGEISKYLIATGEYAVTQKQGQAEEAAEKATTKDKSAYNFILAGTIPSTSVNLEAGYEFAGRAFENNTLPVLMSGTEKLRLAGKTDFFRSFLTLGVEYNYLLQNSFNSKGKNSRWGFDIATHSKRYPSIYVAYKPFSSFRSYDDTLQVEQRPIIGEVWTGRMTYQIKKQDRAIRFSLLYNRNTSIMDTVAYGSSTFQLNTVYTRQGTMFGVNIGTTSVETDMEMAYPAMNDSRFVNVMLGGSVSKRLMLNGGTDIAGGAIGLTRYGCNIGGNYRLDKIPIMIRTNLRYSSYRLDAAMAWKPLYAGGVEVVWRISN